mgnify:CR=1 FL=1
MTTARVYPICPKCQARGADNKVMHPAWPVVEDGILHLRFGFPGNFLENTFLCGKRPQKIPNPSKKETP